MASRPMSAMRARRLLGLLPHLRRGETLSLASLARAVGATPAEVAADLGTLSMCGLPPFSPYEMIDVYVEGDAVEVYADPPSLTHPVRLTAEESAALVASLEACGHPDGDPLTAKLLAASAPDVDGLALAVRAAVSGETGDVHAIVTSAVTLHEALRIRYQASGRDSAEERVIEPWALGNDRGAWYVSAWCRTAGAERTFRLDRMLSAQPAGEAFAPPSEARPPVATFARAADLPRATVRFAAGSRGLEERDWPGATFREETGGAVLAEIPYSDVEWVVRRVVARLGEAEVLAPKEVREAVVAMARLVAGGAG
jgi:predicted DNA-binding transcriptional regulator YafY